MEAQLQANTGLPQFVLDGLGDYFVQLPVPDTMTNGQCVVEAEISLSKVTGDPKDDTVAAVKWEYEGCTAATAGLAGVRTAIRSRFDSRLPR